MMRRTAVSAEPPITEAEARAALRIRHTAESAVLVDKLAAAVDIVERRTGRTLRPTTFELTLRDWPCFNPIAEEEPSIDLPAHPIREIVSLEYRNAVGAWVEVPGEQYDWRRLEEGGELYTFSTFSPPSLDSEHRDRVRVTFSAGYERDDETGGGDDPELILPPRARELVLLLAGHLYENREATTNVETFVLPLALDMIRQDLRIFR